MPGASSSIHVRVGAGRVEISPPRGVPLAGYPFVDRPCRGIHDPLYATALVFEAQGRRAGVVALDLLAVGPALVGTVRAYAARSLDIPAERLLISATHTHSAPTLEIGPGADAGVYGQPDATYAGIALTGATAVLDTAVASLREAGVFLSHGRADGVASNRRHPGGVTDPEVAVLTARDARGDPLACLLNYACHPTVLHADNDLASSDFPWAARATVERHAGGITLYTTGAAGDQSTRYTRRAATFEEAARLGGLVGDAAVGALDRAVPVEGWPIIGALRRVDLPMRRMPSLEEADRAAYEASRRLERLHTAGAPRPEIRTGEVALFGARHTARYARAARERPGDVATEVQVLTLGGVRIVGLPAEVFAEQGLWLRARGDRPVIVVCGANDMVGYAPPRVVFDEGGYEPSSTLLGPDAGDRLLDAALGLLRTVSV